MTDINFGQVVKVLLIKREIYDPDRKTIFKYSSFHQSGNLLGADDDHEDDPDEVLDPLARSNIVFDDF